MKTAVNHDHTRAREVVLRVLYQLDLRGIAEDEPIRRLMEETLEDLELVPQTSKRVVGRYARKLLHGVLNGRDDFDARIRKVAQNWDLERMAIIDRNVIRIGAFEILVNPDIPRAVAINEAIELARKYSTEESGTFVNGILDQMRSDEP